MEFRLPTREMRKAKQATRSWEPCFLFWPRRARNHRGQLLESMIVGRAMRRRISRDCGNLPPYVWQYMDRAEFVAAKLAGDEP